MKIIIRDSKGGVKTIKISPNKKVSDLKDEIENENKSKNNIELIFNGMILENDYTLDELGIQEGNTIDYIGIFLAGLNKY